MIVKKIYPENRGPYNECDCCDAPLDKTAPLQAYGLFRPEDNEYYFEMMLCENCLKKLYNSIKEVLDG